MKGGVTASGVRFSIFSGRSLGGCGWFLGLVVLDVGVCWWVVFVFLTDEY